MGWAGESDQKGRPMKALGAAIAMAVLQAAPQVAAQTGSAPFCLQTTAGTRCVFGTIAECENARSSSSSSQCITRTDAHGTTGLGEPPSRSTGTPTELPSSTGR